MIYFIMLVVIPLGIAAVVSYFFADKKFLVGKEPDDITSELKAIDRQIASYVNGLYTPLRDYTIQITVQDGKVQKVATETDLTRKALIFDESETEPKETKQNKGCSLLVARIGMAIYVYCLTFLFFLCFVLLLEALHLI